MPEPTGQLSLPFEPAGASTPGLAPQTRPSQPTVHSAKPGGAIAANPNANARIRLADLDIPYELRRSRRRTIGLLITDHGLRVTAPQWVAQREIDRVLLERTAWIVKRLQAWQARNQRLRSERTRWESGATLPYLGVDIRLQLQGAGPTHFVGDPDAPAHNQALCLALPQDASADRIQDSVQAWLKARAQAVLGQRLDWALCHTGVNIRRWRLSSAATRWGSCSSVGNIMLNWRLIHFSLPVIDYVIVHELAHLREMNHGPDFWAEVERYLPDYRVARDQLRRTDPASLPTFQEVTR